MSDADNELIESEQAMLEEEGVVESLADGYAMVRTTIRSSCGGCSNGTCGTNVLARWFEGRRNLIRVADTIGLQPGDRVRIGLPERRLVSAALWAYLLPLVMMLGMALWASLTGWGDLVCAAAAILGLAGGLALVSLITAGDDVARAYQPVLLADAKRIDVQL